MKRSLAWRFTCEHCGKNGYSGGHMARHESACTKNPNRVCRMCKEAGEKQRPIAALMEALAPCNGHNPMNEASAATIKAAVDDLRELANGCPACMLAAIRQSAILYDTPVEYGVFHCPSVKLYGLSKDFFDYKAEKKEFWAPINDERRGED